MIIIYWVWRNGRRRRTYRFVAAAITLNLPLLVEATTKTLGG